MSVQKIGRSLRVLNDIAARFLALLLVITGKLVELLVLDVVGIVFLKRRTLPRLTDIDDLRITDVAVENRTHIALTGYSFALNVGHG